MCDTARWGAFLDEELIGVTYYEVLADPTEVEVALAVSGTVQAHGVGTLLWDHLVSLARRHGVRRFVAEVLTENGRMLRVFADCGPPCQVRREGSVTHVELVLDEIETYLDAVLCVPAHALPEVAEQCGQRGVRALVVISAGRTRDTERHDRLLAAVRRYGMRMVGPNWRAEQNGKTGLSALLQQRADCPRLRSVQSIDDGAQQAEQNVHAEFVTSGNQRGRASQCRAGDDQRGGRPARWRTVARTSSGGGPPNSLVTCARARSLAKRSLTASAT
jgi:hypothetical protein